MSLVYTKIIDALSADLVRRIEAFSGQGEEGLNQLNELIQQLVARLTKACAHREVVARYKSYREGFGPDAGAAIDAYSLPMGEDGFVKSFDPLTEEKEFYLFWQKYGIVVSKNAVLAALCEQAISAMHRTAAALSGGKCLLAESESATWANLPEDGGHVPLLSRGFFELYHDDAIAALRQSIRVYLHYVLIWGRADLWTTFDRLGIKLPGHKESGPLPLHVDQNPNVHPDFRTVQGVLALRDCPVERGTFVGVPGSRKQFGIYSAMAENQGEYVQLNLKNRKAAQLRKNAQACPMAQGSLISWDSRTTHANSENVSDKTRYVAYISAGPAAEDNAEAVAARVEAFATGVGKNVRGAMMHASKPPRYTNAEALAALRVPERLTLLGSLLYGNKRYSDL